MVGFGAAWFGALICSRGRGAGAEQQIPDGRAQQLPGRLVAFQNRALASTPVASLVTAPAPVERTQPGADGIELPGVIESAFKNNVSNQLFANTT
jgi:hypothetical protein